MESGSGGSAGRRITSGPRHLGAAGAFLIATAGPAVVVLALNRLDQPDVLAVAAIVDLLPVMVAGAMGGPVWGVFGALVSTITLGVWFIGPEVGAMRRPADALPLLSFFVVATIASRLVAAEHRGRVASQQMRERLSFLVRCDEVFLETALDMDKTLEVVADVCVPTLSDLCMVTVSRDGWFRTTGLAFSPQIHARMAESLRHQDQPPADATHGVGAVYRTGVPELWERIDEDTLDVVARNPRHAVLLRGLGVRSCMFVPMVINGRVEGVAVFANVSRRRRLTQDHLDLAREVVARACGAVELARAHAEKSETARVLQEALLPSVVPVVEGLDLEARFVPFGASDLVGGDFYDVFDAGEGRIVAFVGDVCGKGAASAATAGLARHSLRILARYGEEPAVLLRALNAALRHAGAGNLCTIALLTLRREGVGWQVRLARAGHPPVLVRRGDHVEQLFPKGTILGVLPEPVLEEETFALGPGDLLAIYTDGLLDERRVDAEDALAEAFLGASPSAKEVADRLVEEPPGEVARDDKAIVVLGVPLPS